MRKGTAVRIRTRLAFPPQPILQCNISLCKCEIGGDAVPWAANCRKCFEQKTSRVAKFLHEPHGYTPSRTKKGPRWPL